MLLVTVDDVISSMGLSTSLKEDLSATITSTIEKAQVLLSTILGSSITPLVCEDKVHINLDVFAGVTSNGTIKVKLSNLFIDKDSIKVVSSTALGSLGEKIKPLHVNAAQGELFFPLSVDSKYLTISYESGLTLSTMPRDIKAALLLLVARVFTTQQPNSSDAAPPKNTEDMAAAALAHYTKTTPFSFRPFSYTYELQ